MMTGKELMEYATVRDHFRTLRNYIDFARAYLDFAQQGLQARIVCQNETDYQFFQYREDCTYNISRPINARLFFGADEAEKAFPVFLDALSGIRDGAKPSAKTRTLFVRAVYTMQHIFTIYSYTLYLCDHFGCHILCYQVDCGLSEDQEYR